VSPELNGILRAQQCKRLVDASVRLFYDGHRDADQLNLHTLTRLAGLVRLITADPTAAGMLPALIAETEADINEYGGVRDGAGNYRHVNTPIPDGI
jgi:hypothetical protein